MNSKKIKVTASTRLNFVPFFDFFQRKKSKKEKHASFENFKNVQLFKPNSISSTGTVPTIFFNTCFDKNHLKIVIAWFLDQYGEKVTVDLVETLKQVGFHQATRAGVSLGVDDLKIPPQKGPLLFQASGKMSHVAHALETGNLTGVEKSQRLIDTWNQTSETLRQTAVHNFRTTNPVNPVYMMAFSGARGNISQVRQLVAMRGLMADPQGAILEFPIQSNFREGLTITEYLISCYGARKGLVDTALRTATSGYLTRRLVDAVQHVVIHVTNCETKKGILIKEKNLEQRLVGRLLLEDFILNSKTVVKKNTLICVRLAKQIAAKQLQVSVRSPLTCETEKSVCQFCYGVDLAQGKLVSLGEAVGIIAAQSIGEPGTQLTMRTFHTGGVGVFSDQAMKSFTAPFEGKIEFLGSLPGLFVRTPHGNIVYLLKHKTVDHKKIILRVTSSHSTQKSNVYEIKHGDVPSGSLLWVKEGEFVKTGQLLLQASRLQTSRQEMPESSHPVRAPLSGEVFFQFIKIRLIEEEKRFPLKSKKKKQDNPLLEFSNSNKGAQINQKEISPTFATLLELGNFWVFSSFIQKEDQISRSFLLKGDLLSSETPIQQYNFQVPYKGQLKKLHSSFVFANPSLQFIFSKIAYSGLFYFFLNTPSFGKNFFGVTRNVIAYTTNSRSTRLSWYPFFKNLHSSSFGYYLKFKFETDFFSAKNFELNVSEKFRFSDQLVQSCESGGSIPDNYFWTPHDVFSFKRHPGYERMKNFSPYCFFLVHTDSTFSKMGIFQLHRTKRINWSLKKRSQNNSRKNPQTSNFIVTSSFSFIEKEFLLHESVLFPKTKFLEKGQTQKISIDDKIEKNSSCFISNALARAQIKLQGKVYTKVIEKKQSWFYLPEKSIPKPIPSELTGIILEPGKKLENLSFQHSYVSANLLFKQNVIFVKSKRKTARSSFSYYIKDLLIKTTPFRTLLENNFNVLSKLRAKCLSFNKIHFTSFCFYKKQQFNQKKTQTGSKKRYFSETVTFKEMLFELKRKRRLYHLLLFQKISHHIVPDKKFLYEAWLLDKQSSLDFSFPQNTVLRTRSPLFTKQIKTFFDKNQNQKSTFKFVKPSNSEWISITNFFKVELEFQTSKTFGKLEEFRHKIFLQKFATKNSLSDQPSKKRSYEFLFPGLRILFYRKLILKKANNLCFQTFQDGWVLRNSSLTTAFIKSKKLGEFRRFQIKQKEICLSIVQTQDLVNLVLLEKQSINKKEIPSYNQVGARIRWSQELIPGFGSSLSGQIIKMTSTRITLRKGLPLLASIRGLLHITHNDLIQKHDLLITLRSRRLQTEDIVQGIPKIEQLFEARETQGGEIIKNNMHMLLNKFFNLARQIKPLSEAVELSLTYIQKFLVENILQAYSNQGVNIAEKHVEVVVRQMTARVRITHGGESGFLPGEFVQIRLIQKINHGLAVRGRCQAVYEPVILGITKSVLQSESFLLAASFQQVSKVLVRSALSKKTDFLRGLHENLLVGQAIPAGTGLIHLTQPPSSLTEAFDSGKIPPKSSTFGIRSLNSDCLQ
jgi:hypothetical protein